MSSLPPSSRVDPCRMFPSRRHRGSIHVVCPPSCPFLLPNRPSCSLHVIPALCRHSRDGGNLDPCLPSFPLPIVIPALCRHSRDGGNLDPCLPSFPLPIVIPALCRHSRDGGNLVTCVRRLSIEAPATRYFHGAEPVAVRSGPAMAERTLSIILIRTTRGVWFCGGRIPRTGSDRDLRVFYAYRPCLLYNLAHCERGGNAP